MADFTTINQEIDNNIKQNGVNAITGQKLNTVLKDMMSAVNTEKQDTIDDLAEIRTGAEAGAAAYQMPEEGIPSRDLSEGVQKSLENADNAVLYEEQSTKTDQQRNTALANVSNQTANSTTGKMGYKVLDGSKSFASQVSETNTIYEIRDVFDLEGTSETPVTFSVPIGSKLKFDGGLLKNCTLSGNDIFIESDGKCFDNVKLATDCVVKNDEIRLSWFVQGNDDCADVLTNLLNIPNNIVFLDKRYIYISHPIVITKRTRSFHGFEFIQPRNESDVLSTKCTVIRPTNNYSSASYDFNSAFIFKGIDSQADSGKQVGSVISNITIQGYYTIGYGFRVEQSDLCNTMNNIVIGECFYAGICVNGSTEDTLFNRVRITNCGCGIFIGSRGFDENNALNIEVQNTDIGAVNNIKIIDCTIMFCNYGFVGRLGSNTIVSRCNISHNSCYAIYVANYNLLSIENNYIENNGIGTFWIDSNGMDGSVDGNVMATHLSSQHLGEDNNNVIGWGESCELVESITGRIRSVVTFISNNYSSFNIENNYISVSKIRNNINSASYFGSIDDTTIGIDTVYVLRDGKYVVKNTKINGNETPKTFVANMTIQDRGAIPSHISSIVLDDTPIQYYNKNWYVKLDYLANSATNVNVLRKPQNAVVFSPYNSVVNNIGNTSFLNVNDCAIKSKVVDGYPYWNLRNRTESPHYGYMVYLFAKEFFTKDKFVKIPVIYEGTNNTNVIYTLAKIKSGTRTVLQAFVDIEQGKSPSFFISNLLFGDDLDYVELDLRLSQDDANMLVGPPLIYEIDGTLLTKLDESNVFGLPKNGTTSKRPSYLTSVDIGFMYYDTTLNKYIYWNGTSWVNLDGTALT